ncbi:hypothetical protein WR25_12059 [Diploscapter pachys]|uniref:Uncharacterized protein n=1 Tax=Diploscapter pachys TaxID=2018661 RepID=A0A2A2M442_9BILA|nr:hypothetical protein WR25_12059 [Diploscapter pachys]
MAAGLTRLGSTDPSPPTRMARQPDAEQRHGGDEDREGDDLRRAAHRDDVGRDEQPAELHDHGDQRHQEQRPGQRRPQHQRERGCQAAAGREGVDAIVPDREARIQPSVISVRRPHRFRAQADLLDAGEHAHCAPDDQNHHNDGEPHRCRRMPRHAPRRNVSPARQPRHRA